MLVLEDHHSLGMEVRSTETSFERQSLLLFHREEMTGLCQEHRVSFKCFRPKHYPFHAAFGCRRLRAAQEAVEGQFEQMVGV